VSLILDALRRAEAQDEGAERDVFTEPPVQHRTVRRIPMAVAAGGLLGALIAVSLMGLVDGPGSTTTSNEVAPANGAIVASPALGSGSSSVTEQEAGAGHTAALDVDQAAKAEEVAALNARMWAEAEALQSLPEVPQQQTDAGLATIAPTVTDEQEAAFSIAPPVDLAKAIERAAQAAGESSLEPHPVVLLEHLSQQQKDRIPTIVYTDHDVEGPGPSVVEINGRRVSAGQRVESVVVEEILSDSVILRVDDTMFRLRALNTWVNL